MEDKKNKISAISNDFDVPAQSSVPNSQGVDWTPEQQELRRKIAEFELHELTSRRATTSIAAQKAGAPSYLADALDRTAKARISQAERTLAERERDCLGPDFKPH